VRALAFCIQCICVSCFSLFRYTIDSRTYEIYVILPIRLSNLLLCLSRTNLCAIFQSPSFVLFLQLCVCPNSYVDGMAFHWYAGGMDRLQDGTFGYHFLAKAHQMLEDSQATTSAASASASAESSETSDTTASTAAAASTPFMLGTEGCNCPGTETAGTALSWLRSERYAHDILQDLNHYASGWVDWNLLLSAEGGPNHLGNLCDAPILATPAHDDITVQPYLFTIGHFSKFFVPGTQIVHSTIQADFSSLAGAADASEKAKNKVLHGGPSKVVSGAALTTWPCDGSSRQRFSLPRAADTEGARLGALQLADDETWGEAGAAEPNLKDHNSDAAVFPTTPSPDAPLKLCVSNANNAATGQPAQVLDCSAGEWVGAFALPAGGSGQLKLQNPPPPPSSEEEDPQPALCLGAVPAYSELMTQSGGGPVTLAPCAEAPHTDGTTSTRSSNEGAEGAKAAASLWAHQQWAYSEASQSVVSMAPSGSGGGQCLTASWPFLQAVVGVTPKGATVAVVVNEASVSMNVQLAMEDGTSITAKLPRESIQTFVVENPEDPEAFI